MLLKLRHRMSREESGFTLVELLVVMLIIGLLAAIAIPAFFKQRDKAKDAGAKEMAHTSQVAMETYATDNGGTYTGATPAALAAVENTIQTAPGPQNHPYLSAAAPQGANDKGWTLTVTSPQTASTFTIDRNAATGALSYTCTVGNSGGCPPGGDWSN